jgi:hypothetical protein
MYTFSKAEELGKHPVTATGGVVGGIEKRRIDENFRLKFEEFDRLFGHPRLDRKLHG